jgi:hypothetical protein
LLILWLTGQGFRVAFVTYCGYRRDMLWGGKQRVGAVAAVSVCLIASLALAAPAGASTLGATKFPPDPAGGDFCGPSYQVNYGSQPGEANRVDASFTPGQMSPIVPTPGPSCPQVSPDVAKVVDSGAAIITSSICHNLGPRAGRCTANSIVAYRIHVGDQRDIVHVTAEWPPGTVIAGNGNDSVNTVNGSTAFSHDHVSCGAGVDGATVDAADTVSSDCEAVTRY